MNKVDLFNLAISSCGSEALISNPAENTREAALCRLWLTTVRRHIISTAPWPSSITHHRLTLLRERAEGEWTEADEPTPGYLRTYHVPGGLLLPYYMHSFQPFQYNGDYIYTNEESPTLFYLQDEDDPAKWDHGLFQAIMHYLAARIARPLTGSSELVKENFEIAQHHIETAQANAAEMFQQPASEVLPDWILARGYGGSNKTRFFYSFHQLNSVVA